MNFKKAYKPAKGYTPICKIGECSLKKLEFGIIEFLFAMKNETVESLSIFGDFFEDSSVSELEESFKGKTLNEITKNYRAFKVENYIYGMTSDNLLELMQSEILPENNI